MRHHATHWRNAHGIATIHNFPALPSSFDKHMTNDRTSVRGEPAEALAGGYETRSCDASCDDLGCSTGKECSMRRTIGYALCAVTLLLGIWLPVICAGEAKEKPAIEQILDILLQRGQITPEEYRSLQEKVKQEQAAGVKEPSAAVLAGIEKGKPFLKSADDNFRLEFGGRLQADFQAAEDGTRTLTGPFLGSQFLIRRDRV